MDKLFQGWVLICVLFARPGPVMAHSRHSLSSAILRRRTLFKSVFQIDHAGRCRKPSKILSTSASRTLAGISRSFKRTRAVPIPVLRTSRRSSTGVCRSTPHTSLMKVLVHISGSYRRPRSTVRKPGTARWVAVCPERTPNSKSVLSSEHASSCYSNVGLAPHVKTCFLT